MSNDIRYSTNPQRTDDNILKNSKIIKNTKTSHITQKSNINPKLKIKAKSKAKAKSKSKSKSKDKSKSDSKTRIKKSHKSPKQIDIIKHISNLPVLMTLTKITREYIDKMKMIVRTSTDKNNVHKYVEWILCMTFFVPVINLYINSDARADQFITRCEDIKNNSIMNICRGNLTYYNVHLPHTNEHIDLTDLVSDSIDITSIRFMHHIITNRHSCESEILTEMFKHIYFVICDLTVYDYIDININNDNNATNTKATTATTATKATTSTISTISTIHNNSLHNILQENIQSTSLTSSSLISSDNSGNNDNTHTHTHTQSNNTIITTTDIKPVSTYKSTYPDSNDNVQNTIKTNVDKICANHVLVFCWQFKDNTEQQKINRGCLKQINQLIPRMDNNNIYVHIDQNEWINSILENIDINDESEYSDELKSSMVLTDSDINIDTTIDNKTIDNKTNILPTVDESCIDTNTHINVDIHHTTTHIDILEQYVECSDSSIDTNDDIDNSHNLSDSDCSDIDNNTDGSVFENLDVQITKMKLAENNL